MDSPTAPASTSLSSLVDEARRLAPELAAAAPGDDALRRLGDATWKRLLEGRFLRALQPARWGGGEVHFLDFVDAAIELSAASPSAGWVAGVIGVHPWQLALFAEEAQQDMWGEDPSALHSSSYNPTGKAEAKPGGYELSGRWSFSSGCDHCRGVNLGAITGAREVGEATLPDFRSFLLLPGQYRIEDNWHVAGLRGTGSKDIVVDGAFVPEHRTQSHLDYALDLPLPGRERNDGPLYRLPWSVVFNMALAASVLGSARGFVEAWIYEARERVVLGTRVADDPLVQRRLAEATWDLEAGIARLRADVREIWEMAEASVPVSMAQRAHLRWNMNRSCELVGCAVSDLFHAASGRTIYLDHPLQRRFQDVQGALGHAYLGTDPVARAVGGNLMGATKPEFTL
jgi:3-hydroxy-9,10-secoandrosta-1,3,5(10)-triene-9,17-dione monooxygenase